MTPECKIPTIILIIFLQGCGGANSENPTSASLTTSHQQQISSEPPTTPISPGNQFSANVDYIFKDGERLDIKAMVYVVGEPGYLPWDIEVMPELPAVLQARIDTDLTGIKALGANTVRLWGAPAYGYQAI